MSRKFQVGDRVRITGPSVMGRVGVVATVTDVRPMRVRGGVWMGYAEHGEPGCVLDLSPPNSKKGEVAYPPRFLEPVYDGNERVSWSECAWQPKSLVQS